MITLSPEAEAQLDALIAHCEALGRVEASTVFEGAESFEQGRAQPNP